MSKKYKKISDDWFIQMLVVVSIISLSLVKFRYAANEFLFGSFSLLNSSSGVIFARAESLDKFRP